jgi:hypothetical protein
VRKLFPESGLRHEKPFDAMRDVGGRVVIAWSSRGHRVVIAWSSRGHRGCQSRC